MGPHPHEPQLLLGTVRDVGGIEDPVDPARVEVVDAVHVDGHFASRDADGVEQRGA